MYTTYIIALINARLQGLTSGFVFMIALVRTLMNCLCPVQLHPVKRPVIVGLQLSGGCIRGDGGRHSCGGCVRGR